MKDGIDYSCDQDGIALLQVNRPAARNALDWAAQEAFARTITAVAADPDVRVLIITGSGDKAFVAGGDLKELSHHPEAEAGVRLNRVMSEALAQLADLPIPVIAAVNGDAYGGGCEILTACDLRLAAAHARFSFAQVRNALTTGWGGAARLVRLIGQSQAMELLLTARLFDVHEAQQMGLVHRIVPTAGSDGGLSVLDDDQADAVLLAAQTWARTLLALPQTALAAMKQLVYGSQGPLPEAYALESQLFTELWSQPDHVEALTAFVEKRPPQFGRKQSPNQK